MRLKVGSPYAYGFKRENPEAYVVFGSAKYDDGEAKHTDRWRTVA